MALQTEYVLPCVDIPVPSPPTKPRSNGMVLQLGARSLRIAKLSASRETGSEHAVPTRCHATTATAGLARAH